MGHGVASTGGSAACEGAGAGAAQPWPRSSARGALLRLGRAGTGAARGGACWGLHGNPARMMVAGAADLGGDVGVEPAQASPVFHLSDISWKNANIWNCALRAVGSFSSLTYFDGSHLKNTALLERCARVAPTLNPQSGRLWELQSKPLSLGEERESPRPSAGCEKRQCLQTKTKNPAAQQLASFHEPALLQPGRRRTRGTGCY